MAIIKFEANLNFLAHQLAQFLFKGHGAVGAVAKEEVAVRKHRRRECRSCFRTLPQSKIKDFCQPPL